MSGKEIDLDGTPGLMAHEMGMAQLIWPATQEESHATTSVYGTLPRDELTRIATSMQN